MRSYDSAPRPHTPPLSPVSKSSLFLSLPVCVGRAYWLEKGGGGVGRGAKLYDREKVWPSRNHSILFGNKVFFPHTLQSTCIVYSTYEYLNMKIWATDGGFLWICQSEMQYSDSVIWEKIHYDRRHSESLICLFLQCSMQRWASIIFHGSDNQQSDSCIP